MEIIALVESEDHVCTRYRISAYANSLAQADYTIRYQAWPRTLIGMMKLAGTLRGKTVILQRKLPHLWLTWLLRKSCKHLIFDFDDAVFLRDSYSKKGLDDPSRLSKFSAICKAADAIAAGNQFLATAASEQTDAAKVRVIPTVIETSKYPVSDHLKESSALEMVWIGSRSTLQSLDKIKPILESLGQNFPQLKLKVICDSFPSFNNLMVIPMDWHEDREVDDIVGSDLGICFMPDDRWSKGKCGLKLLQYMAAGLPVIANPVGVHCEIIHPNVNGFLVETYEEWAQAISFLQADKTKRIAMGSKGRALVETRYSVNANAEKWLNLLNKVCQQELQAG